MEINKEMNGSVLTVKLSGKLDTLTAPALEEELKTLPEITSLVFDLKKLSYISSAGLRILLATHKKLTAAGNTMIIQNVNSVISEILDMTGFTNIFTIE